MRYKKGYKYQLTEQLQWQTGFSPSVNIITRFIELTTDGLLTLKVGFAWDGCSGPVIDRATNMLAGAIHDGLYRLMRQQKLDHNMWRMADNEFRKALHKAGAWPITIKVDMRGLKWANGSAANPKNKQKEYQV